MTRYLQNFMNSARPLAVAALCTFALTAPALAQAPTDTLAGYITQQFGANNKYQAGQLGKDWCFTAEREIGYNWWYYDAANTGAAKPTQITNIVKVQGMYLDPNAGFRKYASVFFGLDGSGNKLPAFSKTFDALPLKAAPYKPNVEKVKVPSAPPPPPVFGTSSGNVLTVPTSADASSNCSSLGQFLMAYSLPFTPTMKFVPGLQVPAWQMDNTSFTNYDPATGRYWMFNGQAHQVVNIMSYAFSLNAEDGTLYPDVKLVVGVGGGAGP